MPVFRFYAVSISAALVAVAGWSFAISAHANLKDFLGLALTLGSDEFRTLMALAVAVVLWASVANRKHLCAWAGFVLATCGFFIALDYANEPWELYRDLIVFREWTTAVVVAVASGVIFILAGSLPEEKMAHRVEKLIYAWQKEGGQLATLTKDMSWMVQTSQGNDGKGGFIAALKTTHAEVDSLRTLLHGSGKPDEWHGLIRDVETLGADIAKIRENVTVIARVRDMPFLRTPAAAD